VPLQLPQAGLEAGRWTLDAGRWKLEAGRWTLEAGRWKLDAGSWTLEAGRWKLDAGSWKLEAGRWTLEAGRWTLDAGSWTLDAGRWTLDAGRWKLDACINRGMLAAEHLRVVAGAAIPQLVIRDVQQGYYLVHAQEHRLRVPMAEGQADGAGDQVHQRANQVHLR
jgi:formate dehydrogenase subunit delta